jgi:endonuclease/exonuclease/phosphatase (EEP) superfamily protein YafD
MAAEATHHPSRWQRTAPRRPGLIWIAAWAAFAAFAALVLARHAFHDRAWPLLLANMFTLYLFVPVWALALVALVGKRWRLVGVTALLCAWHAAHLLPPLLPRDAPAAEGEGIRLVTANLLMVHPAPDRLAVELEAMDPDVLVLQEYSSRWQETTRRRGWFETYPHHAVVVRDDSFGCALFSRFPLEDVSVVPMAGLPQLQATIRVDGVAVDLLDVHTLPPRIAEYVPGHRRALADIEAWAAQRSGDRPFLITGDFNATPYSRFHRRISRLADDAWELGGSGYGHTAPNGMFPLPPMRLDHIYLSPELTVREVELGRGLGSDHRPIAAVIALGMGGGGVGDQSTSARVTNTSRLDTPWKGKFVTLGSISTRKPTLPSY